MSGFSEDVSDNKVSEQHDSDSVSGQNKLVVGGFKAEKIVGHDVDAVKGMRVRLAANAVKEDPT